MTHRSTLPQFEVAPARVVRILPRLTGTQAFEVARELLEQAEDASWGEGLAAALAAHLRAWRPEMPRCFSDELKPTEPVPSHAPGDTA